MQASLRRGLVDRGGLGALVAAVVYAATASPYVVDGDNAEFVTLGTIGGVAHPTGYPAYLVWLRAWTWLPGNPAYVAAIATGVLAALGAWALHAACRAWGARPLAATIIAGAYALGPEVLRVATEADVFAMIQLVAALVLWLAAEAGPLRGARRTLALAFVAGVGLADHVTCVMLAPVGVYGAVRGIRESARPAWLVVAGAIGALALGLAPYAYLAVTADTPAGWTVIDSPRALVDHVMRRDYGGPGAFSPHSEGIRPAANELALLATLGRGLLYAPLAIGLGWLAIACVRPRGHGHTEPAWAWRWLALSLVLAGPLLVARFDVDPVDLGLYVVRRFHLLPLVIASVPAAVGLDRLVAGLSQRYVAFAGAAAIAGGLAFALPELGRVHSPANEVGCANLLRSLPANAVVIGVGGEIHYAAAYLQLIAGVRPAVSLGTGPLTPQPRVSRQAGGARRRDRTGGRRGLREHARGRAHPRRAPAAVRRSEPAAHPRHVPDVSVRGAVPRAAARHAAPADRGGVRDQQARVRRVRARLRAARHRRRVRDARPRSLRQHLADHRPRARRRWTRRRRARRVRDRPADRAPAVKRFVARGFPLALLALLGYAALAPTTIDDGDNAEFAAIAALGGVAHPTGYPLYTLWLRAWSWLPAASPAHAAAIATAILGALVAVAVQAACRAWGARPGPAALAVALVAASPIALRLHTIAEVFALNDLVAAAILLVAAPDGPLRGGRRTVARSRRSRGSGCRTT